MSQIKPLGRFHYVKPHGWSEREGIPTPSMSALTACGKNSAVQLQHGRVTLFAGTTNCPHCQRKLKKGA